MGIEPTGPTLNEGPNGFEDRGRHQACKHFPQSELGPIEPRRFFNTLFVIPKEAANDVPFAFAA